MGHTRGRSGAPLSLVEVLPRLEAEFVRMDLSETTVTQYVQICQRLERECGPLLQPAATVLPRLITWREQVGRKERAKQLSKSRISCDVSALRTLYTALNRMKLYEGNPAASVHGITRARGLPRPMPQLEVEKLFSCIPLTTPHGRRDRLLFELYLHNLRNTEGHTLTTDALQYREAKDAGTFLILIEDGKSEDPRELALHPAVATLMARHLCDTFAPAEWLTWGPQIVGADAKKRVLRAGRHVLEHVLDSRKNFRIFATDTGQPLYRRWVNRRFNYYLKLAGITGDWGPHSLRHRFATNMVENDVDVRVIQEMMGHKDIRTTQIYTQVADTVKVAAVGKLSTPAVREEAAWTTI